MPAGGTFNLGGFETDYTSPGYVLAGYMDNTPVDQRARTLQGDAVIEMFIIDASNYDGGPTYHFAGLTNELKASLVWQGVTYTPFPVKAEGFEFSADGTVPRPKLSFSNVAGLVSAALAQYEDFHGARVTRKRTESRFLDAANFLSGNPNANPNAGWPDDIFYVERKEVETKELIVLELASAADLQGAKIPKRVCVAGTCPWVYKGAECGYAGGLPTCDKTLTDCETHFGANEPLPFGGFPGVGRFRR
jgi:lambda family phage minor tail protein L